MMAAAVAPQKRAGSAASARADQLYPVDIKGEKPEVLEEDAHSYFTKILEEPSSAVEFLSIPGRGKVKLEAPLMHFLPLYKEDSKHKLLVLIDPQDKNTVLAIYLHSSWWLIEDVMKTADHSREGLKQVQTFEERVVLFVLNVIIFGMLERSLTHDVLFVPHSEKECAKIFWRSGDAAAFYTIKVKVCQRFLETHPEEQPRLWEVEAPGDWSQRVSIWLKIQMEQKLQKKSDVSCYMKRLQNDKPGQSDEGQMNQKVAHSPNKALPYEAEEFKDDPEEVFNPEPYSEEYAEEHQTHKQQWKDSKKRASPGEPSEDRISKQFRVTS
ncbi:protein FAM169B isoform X2 [Zootoca vivipara]|uniref:protein FAM169B isoform X2 n=1 Tax=Zootoca vivipara TaxID=8524 RepID=UPI001590FCAE|nr:protein FAM169B isoform X2 [Zootoca vivipara]